MVMENNVKILKMLFENQFVGVLATYGDGQPHMSLVAFIVDDQLKDIIFATPRDTRKYQNMQKDDKVAFLIDDRPQQLTGFHNSAAATAYGKARELDGNERETAREKYLHKYPFLKEFLESPTSAVMKIAVQKYSIVTSFQNVSDYLPG